MARLLAFVLCVAVAGLGCTAEDAGVARQSSPASATAPSSKDPEPTAPIVVFFAGGGPGLERFLRVPAGWTASSSGGSRMVEIQPSTSARDGAQLIDVAPSPGYPAGLKLRLLGIPRGDWKRTSAAPRPLRVEPAATAPSDVQRSVNEGHQPWRLTPEEVAREHLSSISNVKGPLRLADVALDPAVLRLRVLDIGSGRAFEVELARADQGSAFPAWIVAGGLVFDP